MKLEEKYVCDGCWYCCDHCECGPNGGPSPCDLKSGRSCTKCNNSNALKTSQAPPLYYFKINPQAISPVWGTAQSACFDLCACITDHVKMFTTDNQSLEYPPKLGTIKIPPGWRAMIPTGLIFDIPYGYSVRMHSRSGLAVKKGLVLANHEGVIDSDFVEPVFIALSNTSMESHTVRHGDRLAQAEMIPDLAYHVKETSARPAVKTDRTGGFGSTGVQ